MQRLNWGTLWHLGIWCSLFSQLLKKSQQCNDTWQIWYHYMQDLGSFKTYKCTLKTGIPIEEGDSILKLLWRVSCPALSQKSCQAWRNPLLSEIQLGVGIHSEFSSQEQIAYFLTQEAVYFLVHFNFLRVYDAIDYLLSSQGNRNHSNAMTLGRFGIITCRIWGLLRPISMMQLIIFCVSSRGNRISPVCVSLWVCESYFVAEQTQSLDRQTDEG